MIIMNWIKESIKKMAQPNDIPVPGSQPYTEKEPEQNELNWCSSIMIDGNEDNKPN